MRREMPARMRIDVLPPTSRITSRSTCTTTQPFMENPGNPDPKEEELHVKPHARVTRTPAHHPDDLDRGSEEDVDDVEAYGGKRRMVQHWRLWESPSRRTCVAGGPRSMAATASMGRLATCRQSNPQRHTPMLHVYTAEPHA